MKVLCCCILLLSQGVWLSAASQQIGKGDTQPDIELLKERVTQLWTLIQERKKADALEYVAPAARNTFVYRREARILGFTVGDIQVGDDPTEVQVTITAQIRSIISTHPVAMPITERWVFRQGTWFVQIDESKALELFRRSRTKVPVEDLTAPVPN
jgi:hypothetical protein